MHDLDRRTFEAEVLGGELDEAERQEEQEFRELLGELVRGGAGRADEFETYETYETVGSAGEFDDRSTREIALASELLEVQTTAELEQFLGGLLRRIAGGGRRFARSPPAAHSDGCSSRPRARRCRRSPDRRVRRRRISRRRRRDRPDTPATELGLELEGLSAEDREFEAARAFVRFADDGRAGRDARAAGRPARRRGQGGGDHGRRPASARPAGRAWNSPPKPTAQRPVGTAGHRDRRGRRVTRSWRGIRRASAGQGAAG